MIHESRIEHLWPETRRTEVVVQDVYVSMVIAGGRSADFWPHIHLKAADQYDLQIWQNYAVAIVNGTVAGVAELRPLPGPPAIG